MVSAPLLPYCHRHQPPPKQQFTILRGNCWAVLTESDTKRWNRCVDLIYLVGKSAHCCVKAICSSRFLADDSSVYVHARGIHMYMLTGIHILRQTSNLWIFGKDIKSHIWYEILMHLLRKRFDCFCRNQILLQKLNVIFRPVLLRRSADV